MIDQRYSDDVYEELFESRTSEGYRRAIPAMDKTRKHIGWFVWAGDSYSPELTAEGNKRFPGGMPGRLDPARPAKPDRVILG
jgi:hypothetical protein